MYVSTCLIINIAKSAINFRHFLLQIAISHSLTTDIPLIFDWSSVNEVINDFKQQYEAGC